MEKNRSQTEHWINRVVFCFVLFCFLLLVTQDRSFQQLSNNNTLQPRKITNLRRLEYQVLLKLEERSSFFSCQNQNGPMQLKVPKLFDSHWRILWESWPTRVVPEGIKNFLFFSWLSFLNTNFMKFELIVVMFTFYSYLHLIILKITSTQNNHFQIRWIVKN